MIPKMAMPFATIIIELSGQHLNRVTQLRCPIYLFPNSCGCANVAHHSGDWQTLYYVFWLLILQYKLNSNTNLLNLYLYNFFGMVDKWALSSRSSPAVYSDLL